jgi:hypothetical protein
VPYEEAAAAADVANQFGFAAKHGHDIDPAPGQALNSMG